MVPSPRTANGAAWKNNCVLLPFSFFPDAGSNEVDVGQAGQERNETRARPRFPEEVCPAIEYGKGEYVFCKMTTKLKATKF